MSLALIVVIATLVAAIVAWQLTVWSIETRDKRNKYRAALRCREQTNRPLLVVGGPWGARRVRHFFRVPAHDIGDICLDIDRNAIAGCNNGVVADITSLPFASGSFGAVFVSHVLEHLPTPGHGVKAMQEMNRVAAGVFVVSPSRQSIPAWLFPGHRLWVWQKNRSTYFQQRGNGRQVLVDRKDNSMEKNI